jgi:hypothetical protein
VLGRRKTTLPRLRSPLLSHRPAPSHGAGPDSPGRSQHG